jgi:hypothetical protein
MAHRLALAPEGGGKCLLCVSTTGGIPASQNSPRKARRIIDTLMKISGQISAEMIKHYAHIRSKAKEAAVVRMKSYEPPEVSVQNVTPTKLVS